MYQEIVCNVNKIHLEILHDVTATHQEIGHDVTATHDKQFIMKIQYISKYFELP